VESAASVLGTRRNFCDTRRKISKISKVRFLKETMGEDMHTTQLKLDQVKSAGEIVLKSPAPASAPVAQIAPVRSFPGGKKSRPATEPAWLQSAGRLTEIELVYKAETRVLWQFMAPTERPSFTLGLLSDMNEALDMVEAAFADEGSAAQPPIRYLVLASHLPGIFNLGGDLPLFMRLIADGDRDSLQRYARACIDVQYRRAVNLNLPIWTIALVQGDALGGGFEAALAHDLIVAERSAKFALPEVLFSLFPGMGAYSFLSRRLDAVSAERMILSGKTYGAEELHDMGIVDLVVEDGEGINSVETYIHELEKKQRTRLALLQARRMIRPITRKEMVDIVDLWVDKALELTSADLRKMRHLSWAQDQRWRKIWAHGVHAGAAAANA